MKKAIFVFGALAALMIAILSSAACGKDLNCADYNSTYDSNMKKIIDAKCVTCHKSGGAAEATGIYTSYNSMKPAFANAWKQIQDGKMPQSGSPDLTSDEKNAWECWASAGYPQN